MKTEMHHGFRSDSLVSSAVKHIPFYCARARARQLKTKLDRSNVPSIQSRLTLPEQRLLGEQSTTTTSQSILSREGREAQEEQAGEGIPCKAFQDAKVWERAHAKAVRFSSLRIWREGDLVREPRTSEHHLPASFYRSHIIMCKTIHICHITVLRILRFFNQF